MLGLGLGQVSMGGVSQSGIAYQQIPFSGQTTSRETYDEAWQFANGVFDRTPPTNPLYIAELDYSSGTPFYTLKNNNAFGNTNRFTDENGLQVFGNSYFIDHLTGLGYYSVVLNVDTYPNQLTASQSVTTLGYTDFYLANFYIANLVRDYDIISPNLNSLISLFSNVFNAIWISTTRPVSTNRLYITSAGQTSQTTPTNTYGAICFRKHYT